MTLLPSSKSATQLVPQLIAPSLLLTLPLPVLLTVRAIESGPLRCAGIILNQAADTRDAASISNRILLEKLLPHVPIVAEIMHGEECLDPALLASL